MVPWTSIIKPDQEITPFIKMARIGRKKFTRTGRKKKSATKRICHCKPTCNKKLTRQTRKVHYKRLTEEEIGHLISSETCSQRSSEDSSDDLDGKGDILMDERGRAGDTASREDNRSISGKYFIQRMNKNLLLASHRK